MTRQIIDIGIEGNDNTGDSIRESFKKVNENFNELYAIFGIGGQISITDLGDVPEYTGSNRILAVNSTNNGINFLELASDGTVSFDFIGNQLIIKQSSSRLSTDPSPALSKPLNAIGVTPTPIAIDIQDISQAGVNAYNATHAPVGSGVTPITVDSFVINKEYADKNYLPKSGAGGGTRLRSEPATPAEYTLSTTTIVNNNFVINGHGLGINYTGAAFVFNTTGIAPSALPKGTVCYVRIIDSNTISVHTSQSAAENNTNKIALSGATGTFTLTDAAYDSTIPGNWLSSEALPRKSVVRRQGDRLEGALYLHDHPGELAGTVTNDTEDLQAATKLYVDTVSPASQINLFVKTDGDDRQTNTPVGKEGRSHAYAFKTIGSAAQAAEQLIAAAPVEPGPYMQTITHSGTTVNSVVDSIQYANSNVPTRINARTVIIQNKKFLQKETILYIKETYPQFELDEETCERDIDLILESITLDIISGDAANSLSRTAAVRYFSSPLSKRSVSTYRIQTLAAHAYLQNLITNNILTGQLISNPRQNRYQQIVNPMLAIDLGAAPAIVGKFIVIKDIIENGIFSGGIIDGQYTYRVYITNNNSSTDQALISNTDIIPGKLLRGKQSGALGKILSYTRQVDELIVDGTDQVELQLIEPIEFIEGEELEFGAAAQTTQITINVESGTYHEDYPIRIAPNASVNGDEFRRVIVKPKNRISQSPYANTYFYRDSQFDGLNLFENKLGAARGTAYVDPITNQLAGYFGYHYLKDSSKLSNTGLVYNNFGNWYRAYRASMLNKDFIVEQGVEYFKNANPLISLSETAENELINYLYNILEAVAKDLLEGGNSHVLEIQSAVWEYAVNEGITSSIIDTVEHVAALIKWVCGGSSITVYGSSLTYPTPLWPDLSEGSAEPAVWTAQTQYLRNYVIKVGNNYYRARIAHRSGNNFATDLAVSYWIAINGIATTIDNLTNTALFVYNANYNPPKHNRDMDVFLMNDASILRNITVQGHGGFMCVLDPQGQILNKSPYIQTGSSFSQSLNKQSFRGGMFIDGFSGNLQVQVAEKISPYRLRVTSQSNNNGLRIRKPETPCAFYIDGRRFQVNAVINYDQSAGTAELLLDRSSNNGNGFVGSVEYYGGTVNLGTSNTATYSTPILITLQTAGNRSMLGNDFTQINDLGYGLVCVNGALSEMVSMFTYYCHAGYYAKSGSEIRSLTGSTCYGRYGLVSEGADPNEIPEDISLVHDMVQPVRIFEAQNILYMENPVTVVKGSIIQQTVSGDTITAEVVTDVTNSSVIYVKNVQGGSFIVNTSLFVGATNLGSAYEIDADSYLNTLSSLSAYIFDAENIPLANSEIEIYHPIRRTFGKYQVRNVEKTNAVVGEYRRVGDKIPTSGGGGAGARFSIQKTKLGYTVSIDEPGTGYSVNSALVVSGQELGGTSPINNATITITEIGAGGSIVAATITGTVAVDENTPFYNGQVYKLNFTRSDIQFSTLGILEETNWFTDGNPTVAEYRRTRDHIVDSISNPTVLTIRPSTALVFDEYDDFVYRTVSFTQQDNFNNELDSDQVLVTFDAAYDFVRLNIDKNYTDEPDTNNNSKTLGSLIGDVNVAIRPITDPLVIARINDPTLANRLIFSWQGAKYRISNYRTVPAVSENPIYAIVSITKIADIVNTGTGLSVPFDGFQTEQISLLCGLPAGSTGTITFNISTCRATGHDFLDVGKGSYNETNYPNVIFGQSTGSTIAEGSNEVNERGKGRVFYVSTDQNGVFKVGKFFTVDQGTGSIAIAASISLNDIDGLGFRRGVTVSEFSSDSAMSDNDENSVPVESAVRGHVNRRLGFNNEGKLISNTIGPGVMSLGGNNFDTTPMKSNMDIGGFRIVNLANPTANQHAATKKYVDDEIFNIDGLGKLSDVTLTASPANANLLTFTGSGTNSVNATVSGNVTFALSGNTLTSTIANGAIVNAMVSNSASISQSKLALVNATANTQVDATKGISSFDNTFFTTNSGWVSLKDNGIVASKLASVASNTLLGRTDSGTGNVSAISFLSVFNAVGGVIDNDFTTTLESLASPGSALTKTGDGVYAVTQITTTAQANSLVKTDSSGKIRTTSVILGGDPTFEILALSGSATHLKTPSQGLVLSATGGSLTTTPTVTVPGSVIIGTGNAARSTLQTNAGSAINNSSRLKVDWIHTSFIEAAGEKNASSTGIAIGANTGITNEGEVAIATAKTDTNTTVVPFKFSSAGVVPDLTETYNIGSETLKYNNVWAVTFNGTATAVVGADLAENYLADAVYEPGTVLVFGGTCEVTIAGEKGTHKVAGIVSTEPAHLMNSMLQGTHVVALALQGRVPCKVVGPVKKGDLLVNSGVPGYACVDNNAKAGTILGKALEDKTDANKGTIEVVVGKH